MKKHLKRLPAPRSWTLSRKTDFWVAKPSPGPHPIEASVPLGLILRDMLKVCDTAREARHILNARPLEEFTAFLVEKKPERGKVAAGHE